MTQTDHIARWRIVARWRQVFRVINQRFSHIEEELHLERNNIEKLSGDIRRLEAEVDELRADNVRVAELLDLVEQQLTPNPVNRDNPTTVVEPPR